MKKDAALKGSTVFLAWGSLIGDPDVEFDSHRKAWVHDGPVLPLEFSRISSRRDNALTIVIDVDFGVPIKTWYAASKRRDPRDAACDLRVREETIIRHIGLIDLQANVTRSHWSVIADRIALWAQDRGVRAVVWTDLPSNYTRKTGNLFCAACGVDYIKTKVGEKGQQKAREYLAVVPAEVVTPFRSALEADLWFEKANLATETGSLPNTQST